MYVELSTEVFVVKWGSKWNAFRKLHFLENLEPFKGSSFVPLEEPLKFLQ